MPDIIIRTQREKDILYSSKGLKLTNCTIEGEKAKINDGVTYGSIYVNEGELKGLTYIIFYNKLDISEKGDGSVIAEVSKDGILTISGKGIMKT